MSKLRQEMEEKKAKLAALRKAREDRQREARGSTTTPAPSISEKEVLAFVDEVLGTRGGLANEESSSPSFSTPGTPNTGRHMTLPGDTSGMSSSSGRESRQSDIPDRLSGGGLGMSDASTETNIERVLTPRLFTSLVDIEQELYEYPQKERVLYSKEVQTTFVEAKPTLEDQADIRESTAKGWEVEIDTNVQDAQLAEENAKLDRQIEEEIRELSEEERTSILTAPEFVEFVEQSSKFVQRVLNDYDYARDYSNDVDAGGDNFESRRVRLVCEFWDERYGRNRSITDIDWSPKYPELSVASYNKNPAALDEPDGIVAVWNMHMMERPEFVFHSPSDMLSVTFSPFHANLIFGGTYSGQILLWDTRSKHLPVLKTPLSSAGHTHPVYAMQMVGTQNAHNLITSSTDGTVCSWLVDMLAEPQETLALAHSGHNKTSDVAITTLDFRDNETTSFWVGTEEGNIYQANRFDRAGAKTGINQFDVYKGHGGPVTALHFHPLVGPVDFSDMFLTSSVDWTVKLWRAKSLTKPSTAPQIISPIYSFEEADDYVYDVKWHPAHPAMFGTVDGSGKFDLWNLNIDTEVPVISTTVGTGRAINKLKWDKKEGRRVALGGSDGRLYIYDIGDMAFPRDSEWTDMQKAVSLIAGSGQMNSTAQNDGARIVAGR
ncbi:hypothetical protein CVT25_003242 [Psilocybe cyanescens]|uniref:Uncharacterized protein n=1 Tax=Psilocybe cyanescens TaxID=93625 RepID=A0A409WMC4_PSICY|nr:hypothetical protein CVT25_003242 [Psilocybe cyanescens]